MNRLTFLWQGAHYQDRLLQSYRNFHFTLQSVLMATGAGLSVSVVSFDNATKANAVYCLLLITTSLAVYLLRVMRKLILARGADVNYYHHQIMEAEKDLPEGEKVLTAFKVYQKFGKGNNSTQEKLPAADLTDTTRRELIEKHRGHTRQLLDTYLMYGFYLTWICFHIVALIMMVLIQH